MVEDEVREACLQLLAVRQRSRAELAQRLSRKGFEFTQVEPVLDRLAEVELIDDAAFARTWVQSRHRYSGKGKRALAAELKLKGVDDSVAAEALAEVDAASEEERARELVLKRLRTMPAGAMAVGSAAATVRKLVAMLARRGYPQDLAVRVVRATLAERGTGTETDQHPLP